MTTNLPTHLQGRTQRSLIDNAMSGMAGALPPHISIKANRFTLVGADGARQPLDTTSIFGCFVDISDAIGKLYYAYEFQDGSDDPPTCWSANGVVPSREASERQARTCAECQWNVRGSDTSKLSGKAIKACRDEKWTALSLATVQMTPQGQVAAMAPMYPDVLWQLRVTPGSFKNWRGFVERCKSQGVDPSLLLVRIAFEADKNGVLTFQPVSWIDAALADIRDRAWQSKATDALVGRNDQAPALEAPSAAPLSAPAAAPAETNTAPGSAPFPSPSTTQPLPGTPTQFPGGTAAPASPYNPPARRPRRTKAEMEAARAGNGQAPVTHTQPVQPTSAPAAAPFRPAPEQPAQAQPQFGIAQPAQAPSELNSALDSFFGPQ